IGKDIKELDLGFGKEVVMSNGQRLRIGPDLQGLKEASTKFMKGVGEAKDNFVKNVKAGAEEVSKGGKKENVTGETNSTKIGKQVHKVKADERRKSGDYDTVNEPLKDKDGNVIEVPKRIDKQGRPSKKYQRAIPDAVQGPPKGNIIDDKPLGRPISKDKQEIHRFIDAYKQKYGEPPKKIIIERYDPKTGESAGREIYDPDYFKIP
ncbi:hypothetical protein, partial [Clostridium sp. DJ247]|uniref:hypothetical protein n=1 Tax=Clostridium sp. DJ247 TaxID=2726188 RepID=UPI00162A67A1